MRHSIGSMAIVAWAVALTGCGGGSANPLSLPPTTPTPPSITSLSVSPTAIQALGQATVRVVAVDSDGDTNLTAKWSSTFGRFAPASGMQSVYTNTTPAESDVLTVTVSNSTGQQVQASAVVTFTKPPSRSPSSTPSPDPVPSPAAPTPRPSPVSKNRPPTVTVSAAAPSCHPLPSSPCSVAVTANAADPDGDPLTYSWSGCASGSGPTATCAVPSIATFNAAVTVADGRGGSSSASVSVDGVNGKPTLQSTGWLQGRGPLPENSDATLEFQVSDDDSTSSACAPTRVYRMCILTAHHCDGRTGYVDVHITSGTGTKACTIDFVWTDPWGESVTGTGSINVE